MIYLFTFEFITTFSTHCDRSTIIYQWCCSFLTIGTCNIIPIYWRWCCDGFNGDWNPWFIHTIKRCHSGYSIHDTSLIENHICNHCMTHSVNHKYACVSFISTGSPVLWFTHQIVKTKYSGLPREGTWYMWTRQTRHKYINMYWFWKKQGHNRVHLSLPLPFNK